MKRDIEAPPKRYRYAGMERDEESGLHCHGARSYFSSMCRWLSCDPANLADGVNVYAYCHGDPVTLRDTSGRAPNALTPPQQRPDFPRDLGSEAHRDILPQLQGRLASLGFPSVGFEVGTAPGGGKGGGRGEMDLLIGVSDLSGEQGSMLIGHIYELKPIYLAKTDKPIAQVARYSRYASPQYGPNAPLKFVFGYVLGHLDPASRERVLAPIIVPKDDKFRVYFLRLPPGGANDMGEFYRPGFIEYTYKDVTKAELEAGAASSAAAREALEKWQSMKKEDESKQPGAPPGAEPAPVISPAMREEMTEDLLTAAQVAAAIEEAAIVVRGAWTAAAPVAEGIAVGAAGVVSRIFAPFVVVTGDMLRGPHELEPGALY